MNPLFTLWHRFRSLWQSRAVKQEIDDELQFHLAMREQENLRAGMAPQEAAREARRRFGNLQSVREECRQLSGASFGQTVWQDIRFGLRMLRRNPGFTAVAAVTLALGIGVNTTMYSTLKMCLDSRVPYPEPDQLVRISEADRAGEVYQQQSAADFLDEKEQNTVFAHMCAFGFNAGSVNLSYAGDPAEAVSALSASAEFFPTLRVQPILGRAFTAEEEQPGRDDVVLLSERFWKARFGSDPQMVGRTLRLDGKTLSVIGVVAIDHPPLFGGRVDLLRPLALAPWQRANRNNAWLMVLGRLKPEVPLARAQAELAAVGQRIAHDHRDAHAYLNLRAELLRKSLYNHETQRVFWLLFFLTTLVLLIACANLANLQLASLATRTRELGIRAALGAWRARLARQLLTESLVLSLAGGLLGLLLALAGNHLLGRQFVVDDEGSSLGLVIPLDRAVIGFTFLISLLTGVLVGTAPAWLAVRSNVNPALKEEGRSLSAGRSRHRLQNAFIVAEIALALPLLGCAGLMTLRLGQAVLRGPGWKPDGLMAGEITLAGPAYDSPQKQESFLQQLEERVESLPGVARVSLCSNLPFERSSCWRVVIEGEAEPDVEKAPLVRMHNIDRNYFQTLGMTLCLGREFTATEIANNAPVVIIGRTLADKLSPGKDPVGRRISWPGDKKYWVEIVGVVGDLSESDRFGDPFQIYRPRAGLTAVTVLLRATGTPQALAPVLRQAVAELDPGLPVRQFQSARKLVGRVTANERVLVWLIAGFGALGMLLAVVGIYGVTSHVVAQRTPEFGIRMALGAPRRSVLWLVLRRGLFLGLAGALLGTGGEYVLIVLFNAVANNVFDPNAITFSEGWLPMTGAAVALVGVALLACWLPARRAIRIDPMTALRYE